MPNLWVERHGSAYPSDVGPDEEMWHLQGVK